MKAANTGNTEAQLKLAYFYTGGNGQKKNYEKAFSLYSALVKRGELGTLAFLVMALLHLINSFLSSIKWYSLVKIIALVGFLSSVYTLINGVYWIDWVPPELDPEQAGKIAGRRRGGIFLLLIQYWPYASIVFGALLSLVYFSHFINPVSAKEDD